MNKRVYISADYSEVDGDTEVTDVLNRWGTDQYHSIDFVDMSKVSSGTVANSDDCRPCDLKSEFNRQINSSSAVIFVVGKNTAKRLAGSKCDRNRFQQCFCYCTPYKHNVNGIRACKVANTCSCANSNYVGEINSYSYLRHEFEQAKKANKKIIIVYNSLYNNESWLPSYMKGYESIAFPFWTKDCFGNKIGNYQRIKMELL